MCVCPSVRSSTGYGRLLVPAIADRGPFLRSLFALVFDFAARSPPVSRLATRRGIQYSGASFREPGRLSRLSQTSLARLFTGTRALSILRRSSEPCFSFFRISSPVAGSLRRRRSSSFDRLARERTHFPASPSDFGTRVRPERGSFLRPISPGARINRREPAGSLNGAQTGSPIAAETNAAD